MNEANGRQTYYASIGSYAAPEGPGIYACTYNENNGQLTVIDEISGLQDPTFLTVDDANQKLYAISSYFDEQGAKHGEARSFRPTLTVQPVVPKLRYSIHVGLVPLQPKPREPEDYRRRSLQLGYYATRRSRRDQRR